MAAVAAEPAAEAGAAGSELVAAVAAKEAGNAALKSADLPLAIERYEEAIQICDKMLDTLPHTRDEPRELRNNELVQYSHQDRTGFAVVDTAYPQFGDYVLKDLGTNDLVKVKAGKYEEVSRRFRRKELLVVPKELFDVRLACLQNLTLVSLKLARASSRGADFEETIKRADAALSMDGHAAKALMRKGASLIELKKIPEAAQVLIAAAQQTRGRDAEVQRLLEVVLEAKGKGKGRAKGKGKMPNAEAACSSDDEDVPAEGSAAKRSWSPCSYSSGSDVEAFRPPIRAAPAAEAAEAVCGPASDEVLAEGPADDHCAVGAARAGGGASTAAEEQQPNPSLASSGGSSAAASPTANGSAVDHRWPQKALALLATVAITIAGVAAVLMRSAIWDAFYTESEDREF